MNPSSRTDLQAMFYRPGIDPPKGLLTEIVKKRLAQRKAAPWTKGHVWGAMYSKQVSQARIRAARKLMKRRAQAACLSFRYIQQHPGDRLPDGRPKMTRAEARRHNRLVMSQESRRRNHRIGACLSVRPETGQ